MRPRDARAATWVRHEIAVAALRQLVERLNDASIDVLPVKGIVTASLLYDDVSDRPMSDVDLRVRPADFARALDVGRRLGWTTVPYTPRLWDGAMIVPGVVIELEGTVGPPGLCTLSVDELIGRASRRVRPFGFEHLEPEINDHALLLCVNAFKDRLYDLNPWSVADLERIASLGEFRPDVIASRAAKGRISTAVWIVADWLARGRGVSRWGEVRDRIGERPQSRLYARLYAASLRKQIHPVASILLTTAGGDGALAKARGFVFAGAGLVRGGVMRRLTRSHGH